MSLVLSKLNEASLVATSGVLALAAGLPWLERAIASGAISFTSIKVANCMLYALNVFATSQPGRMDGGSRQQENTETLSQSTRRLREESQEIIDKFSTGPRGRSLVLPAGWAFAIWGPIFLGELVFTVSQVFVPETSPLAPVIQQSSGGFMVGQVMQTLWTAAFRPKYKGWTVYISAFLLTGIAAALSRAHLAFTSAPLRQTYTRNDYWIYFLPMTLHFGWTTAACLVNWNGSLAAWEGQKPWVIALAGHLSVVAATVVGVSVTWLRQAPVYGGTIAWALSACAAGMHERIEDMASYEGENDKRPQLVGAVTQKWLCIGGAVLSGLASVVTAFSLRSRSRSV